MKAISKLAILTSVFILIVVIYSFITGESLYRLNIASFRFVIFISIISIGIHINALIQEKAKKLLIILSLFIPSAVIVNFIIGFINWYY